MGWMNILYLVAAAFFVWWAVRFIRNNPTAVSKENMSKSVTTIGWLVLMIIAVVTLCILMLKG